MKSNAKTKCDVCKKIYRTKGLIWLNGRIYCYNCKRKRDTLIPTLGPRITLKEAVKKVYEVKTYRRYKDKDEFYCLVNLPTIMEGYKFKIKLVEDEESKEC